MEYNFTEIEKKWQDFWAENKTFKAEDSSSKPKYYVLDMFPYPSGAGLHVGHPLGYIASDIMARYKRHKGFNVLHPMGYDSFGLPAEQYAIQTGQHPAITTEENIARYRQQLDKIGFSFDWDREVRTSNPDYYKWTQWIFIQLFDSWYNKKTDKAENIKSLIAEFEKNGNTSVNAVCDEETKSFSASAWKVFSEKEKSDVLMQYRIAYLGEAYVNWCPALGTVLANDEVKDGVSERGGHPVERKLMKQWSMRITAYAQRLLDGLDTIDWPESLKESQRYWIGKSEGTSLKFSLIPNPSPKEKGAEPHWKTADPIIYDLLKKYARENKQPHTESEDILWQALRNRKLESVKFRRQHPIGSYIADFISLEQNLIIEVDGKIHDFQKEKDENRTQALNQLGYAVIRFSNEEVMHNLENVLAKIKERFTLKSLSPGEGFRVRPVEAETIEVFTTRPDTIFGVSFVTLAPEHELVEKITTAAQKVEVEAYVIKSKSRSERERQAEVAKVSGVFTGAYVEHPFTGKQIPIWVGDYVLAGYGTGAVMAVPGHDSRDYAFAKHFNLPIIEVVAGGDLSKESYDAKEGKLINSDFLNGLDVKAALKKAIEEIEKSGLGKGKTNYRLRDAVFGRQRYWGEPIPIYYKDGIPHALAENELPLVLPEVDKFLPTEDGEPPLARAKDWKYKPLSNSPQGGEDRTKPRWQTAANSGWKEMKERAKELRNNQTEAESALWEHIKNNQLNYKFRRQQVIGYNIADFVCLEKKLIIEVDGEIHNYQKEYDDARTTELEKDGYRVIRFENKRIFSDIDNVLSEIKHQLQVLPNGEDLGGAYPYEHTTMPGWAGSSWYFLRYMDPKNSERFVSKQLADYWQSVDLYIGGSEHATGHLLYVRFWTKFLKDLGFLAIEEPMKKLINQGMIQGVSEKIFMVTNKDQKDVPMNSTYFPNEAGHFQSETISTNAIKLFISANHSQLLDLYKSDGYNLTAITVPIQFVKNNILDQNGINEFIKFRPEYEKAAFITEGGFYRMGHFEKNRYAIKWNEQFYTRSEVEKMSKSKYNVVSPDDICEKFGADTLRLYEMFLGPLEQSKPWNTNGITGVSGFLKKLWRLFFVNASTSLSVTEDEPTKAELKTLHKTIKKITEDIERFSFNTSVSNFMICVNELTDLKCNKRTILEPLLICLSPYAPHITEELWHQLGHTQSIVFAPFPEFNEAYLVEDSFSYPISFNGKMRFNIELPATLTVPEIEKEVMSSEEVQKYLEGKTPKKIIIVPKKIVNFVV